LKGIHGKEIRDYMKKSILITDKVPEFFTESLHSRGFAVDYRPELEQDELLKALGEHTYILIRGKLHINNEAINSGNFRYILRPGSGVDNIDTKAAREAGVQVITSPEGNRASVGDHTMALLLSLMRHVISASEHVKTGGWSRYEYTGIEMADQVIGIIGYGNTGSAFAQRLSGFPCKIMAYDKYKQNFGTEKIREASPEELFSHATVLSFHVPLNSETHYFFNDELTGKMLHPFWLLNTSRGEVVDIGALRNGLETGKILGAGLDVLSGEADVEARQKTLNILEPWVKNGKVLITPHTAGLSSKSSGKIFQVLLEKLMQI
jgi:D-3-phosphoglycerate dehydrogenase / 2-oxoglutarate reductase